MPIMLRYSRPQQERRRLLMEAIEAQRQRFLSAVQPCVIELAQIDADAGILYVPENLYDAVETQRRETQDKEGSYTEGATAVGGRREQDT